MSKVHASVAIREWILAKAVGGGVQSRDVSYRFNVSTTYVSALIGKMRREGLVEPIEDYVDAHGRLTYVATGEGTKLTERRVAYDSRALCQAYGFVVK